MTYGPFKKGFVHPKIKAIFAHPHVVLNLCADILSATHKKEQNTTIILGVKVSNLQKLHHKKSYVTLFQVF